MPRRHLRGPTPVRRRRKFPGLATLAVFCPWFAQPHPAAGIASITGTFERATHQKWMAYSTFALGNHLVGLAQHGALELPAMKLQRLLFCAHALFLADHGEPLGDDAFVVWPTGPVIPALWHKYRALGAAPITERVAVAHDRGQEVRVYPDVAARDTRVRTFLMGLVAIHGRLSTEQLCTLVNCALRDAGFLSQGAVLGQPELLRMAPLLRPV